MKNYTILYIWYHLYERKMILSGFKTNGTFGLNYFSHFKNILFHIPHMHGKPEMSDKIRNE